MNELIWPMCTAVMSLLNLWKILELLVDRYLMVNFQSFEEIVDLWVGLGHRDKRMLYEDQSAGFSIDSAAGSAKLTVPGFRFCALPPRCR